MPREVTALQNPKTTGDGDRTATRPTREEIAFRAHQVFVQRGGAPGFELEDWLQAERELTAAEPKDLSRQSGPSNISFANRR